MNDSDLATGHDVDVDAAAELSPSTLPPRTLGLIPSLALTVGLQVGSGIFSSPGSIVASTGSVTASLTVWLASGLLAWTGAASFAELGAALPLDGGAQAYLAAAFGPLPSYLFAWTAITVLKPGSCAIIALVFAEYINRLMSSLSSASPEDIPHIPQWQNMIMATAAIVLIFCINSIHARSGSNAQVFLTTLKIGSLFLIIILGAVFASRQTVDVAVDNLRRLSNTSEPLDKTQPTPSSYALALYSGLWAFDGWDQANYVGGQMSDPARDLPRVVHIAMPLVITLFLCANVAYFVVLPLEVVAASNTVGLDFGKAVMGHAGSVLFSAVVGVSCFGALNGSFFTSARLIASAAREGFLPSALAELSPRDTPDAALALQAALSLLYIFFGGGFRKLVNFFATASWTFYMLTVLGLLMLRQTQPDLERPYRTWLITPIIFCDVAGFLLGMSVIAAPLQAVAALVFMASGIPVYYVTSVAYTTDTRDNSRWGVVSSRLHAAFTAFKNDVASLAKGRSHAEGNSTRPTSSNRADYIPLEMIDTRQ